MRFDRLRTFEEVNALTNAAETLALLGDSRSAAAALRSHDVLSPVQKALLRDEPIKTAYLAYVEALVADAAGDTLRAGHRYRAALSGFRTLGLDRRVLVVGLRLADLTADADLARALWPAAAALPAASWLRVEAERQAAPDVALDLNRAD